MASPHDAYFEWVIRSIGRQHISPSIQSRVDFLREELLLEISQEFSKIHTLSAPPIVGGAGIRDTDLNYASQFDIYIPFAPLPLHERNVIRLKQIRNSLRLWTGNKKGYIVTTGRFSIKITIPVGSFHHTNFFLIPTLSGSIIIPQSPTANHLLLTLLDTYNDALIPFDLNRFHTSISSLTQNDRNAIKLLKVWNRGLRKPLLSPYKFDLLYLQFAAHSPEGASRPHDLVDLLTRFLRVMGSSLTIEIPYPGSHTRWTSWAQLEVVALLKFHFGEMAEVLEAPLAGSGLVGELFPGNFRFWG